MSSETTRRHVRILRGACIAFVVLALGIGCSGRRSQQQTEIGNTFLGIGKIAEAYQAFEKAIGLDPQNTQAELGLARCLVAQDKLDDALKHYEVVISREPAMEAAYVEAVQILLRRERNAEATELAAAYEKVDLEKGGVLRAFCLRTTGQPAEAVALLEGLVKTCPKSVDVRIALATALMAANADAKAVEVLEDILETLAPDSLSARIKLVEVYQKQGKIDEIVAQFREMVNQKPGDMNLRLALARSLVDKAEYAEAEEIARSVLAEVPESGWANYVVGACLLARDQRREAIPYLQAAVQALPQFDSVRERLALARSEGAAPAPAQETAAPATTEAQRAPEEAPDSLSWKMLWKQAQLERLLEQSDALLASGEPNVRETLVLAALFSGDRTHAQQLAAGLPADSPLRTFLDALEKRDPNGAIKVFDSWTETDPERAILRDNAYGFALTLIGARAKALQELSERYAKSPQNVVALYNLATMYRAARLPEYAAQVLDRLLALYPGNLEARRTLLRLLIEYGDRDRARGVAELTYQLFPDDPDSVVDVARVYFLAGELDLAQDVLKSALNAIPENASLRIAEARVQLIKGDIDGALQTLEGQPFEGESLAASEAMRAFALASKGGWADVARAAEAVSPGTRPLGLNLLFVSARLYEGNHDAAVAALEQAGDIPWQRIPGGSAVAAALGKMEPSAGTKEIVDQLKAKPEALASYAYGCACVAESFFDDAVAAYEKAASAIPGSPELTVITLDALRGALRSEDPAQKAEAVAQQAPGDPRTWLALAEFYRSKDNAEREAAAIQKALALGEDNPSAWLLQARYLEHANDREGAMAAYERVVALSPGDPIVNNNLAYLLLETGEDAQRAMELAQEALKGSEKNPVIQPHVLHTLGLAELRLKKMEDAEKHLGLALQMRPGDPTLLLDFGTLLIEKGNTEAGQGQIRLALEYANRLGLDFPRRAEAEKLVGAETR
ncbi:MAG TPA: tetratricopeptide repeat protein [Candidatus Hydrogenedentes bacterium]|nr:tetratricopeptide repeat protein [Candidatus Hydrogenedentota bacterium]